jgi:hypothetical protein
MFHCLHLIISPPKFLSQEQLFVVKAIRAKTKATKDNVDDPIITHFVVSVCIANIVKNKLIEVYSTTLNKD